MKVVHKTRTRKSQEAYEYAVNEAREVMKLRHKNVVCHELSSLS